LLGVTRCVPIWSYAEAKTVLKDFAVGPPTIDLTWCASEGKDS